MARFQAKIEDFEQGWISEDLAWSHPVKLVLMVNIFTKEMSFTIISMIAGKDDPIVFDDFETALSRFNELV